LARANDHPLKSNEGQSLYMTDVTTILSRIDSGDPSAAEELLPLVYDELRKLAAARMANEKPGQTLQATALVHEVYVRLVDQEGEQQWDSRGHFFAAAAEAMRRILIDRARAKNRPKHGGDRERMDLEINCPASDEAPERLLAMDEALAKLQQEHPQIAELLKLRYFAGVPLKDAADLLGISPATAKRRWAFARAYLYGELAD
jgi:RNA polymerase sigma factor (TIGR02999 family)